MIFQIWSNRGILCLSRFINARRRIVQPMIDQSNRTGKWEIYDTLLSPNSWMDIYVEIWIFWMYCSCAVHWLNSSVFLCSESGNRLQPWWTANGWLRTGRSAAHGDPTWRWATFHPTHGPSRHTLFQSAFTSIYNVLLARHFHTFNVTFPLFPPQDLWAAWVWTWAWMDSGTTCKPWSSTYWPGWCK